MYVINLIGHPGEESGVYAKHIFHKHNFPNVEIISLTETILENSIKNNVSFIKEFETTDFVQLYKDFQRRLNKAFAERRNVVIDIFGVSNLTRNRLRIDPNYTQVGILFNRNNKKRKTNLIIEEKVNKILYPESFLNGLLFHHTSISKNNVIRDNYEWIMNDTDLKPAEWVDFWKRKLV